jgi:hypothetical protein
LVSEFNRKRNILKIISELFIKGLISEFKQVFRCIFDLVGGNQVAFKNQDQLLNNSVQLLTEYLRNYGEVFFHILSTTRKDSIENDFEVSIDRYEFLPEKQINKIRVVFVKFL